ncbi:MAG: hypothetical protein QM765_22270 [Myxococcales bacterium]
MHGPVEVRVAEVQARGRAGDRAAPGELEVGRDDAIAVDRDAQPSPHGARPSLFDAHLIAAQASGHDAVAGVEEAQRRDGAVPPLAAGPARQTHQRPVQAAHDESNAHGQEE